MNVATLFDTGIRPVIDEHLQKLSEEVRSYGDYWSASSAGYCMRLNIMRRLGVPPIPEIADAKARTQRVFSAGHVFHSWIQEITRDSGLSVAQELELQDEELMIRGHIDDLVKIGGIKWKMGKYGAEIDTESGIEKIALEAKAKSKGMTVEELSKHTEAQHLILYDYKTVNSQAFNFKKDTISHYHRMQLGTYMYMLRRGGNTYLRGSLPASANMLNAGELKEARRLSISKDDLRMAEVQLMWDDKLEEDVLSYWKELNRYWKERTMPPCTCLEHDGGFMGRRSSKGKIYNDYFYDEIPCNIEWFNKWKKENSNG